MKIAFFSNFLNHHQLPLCEAFLAMEDVEFTFVATTPISNERLKVGYEDMNQKDFVLRAYDGEEQHKAALRLAVESDMVIHGHSMAVYEKATMDSGKPFFRYHERFFKKMRLRNFWYVWYKVRQLHGGRKNRNAHMLCASAFTAADAAWVGAYRNKCYKWGYFPKVKQYDNIDEIIANKKPNSILWVARMLALKHPEAPVLVAERLQKEGYDFTLNMIGNGEKEEEIRALIAQKGLEDRINLYGFMSPEKVREHMEEASVFLFTSNKQEGWGAVLNESMNSGCAVVGSHVIGSVPFLLKDKENGLVYRDNDIDDLYNKVKYLLDNPQKAKEMGKAAYETLAQQWNGENAAARFIKLAEAILNGQKAPDLFEDGVCSKAPVLKNHWY